MNTENSYELNLIKKIEKLGYRYLNQEQINKKRKNLMEVLLFDEIEKSLIRLNPEINEKQINEVFFKLNTLKSSSLVESNILFQEYIINGIKIFDDEQERTLSFKIFDGVNDDWIITNQFMMLSKHPQYKHQYPDMVAFCNGIPVIVFELKRLEENNADNLLSAYKQINNYQTYLSDLFVYNAFNVIDNVSEVKFGSITSSITRYQYWRGSNFDAEPSTLYNDLLKPEKAYDVMKNFTFYTSENSPSKIISSYHQYYGVRTAIDSATSVMTDSRNEENGKAGIFWHTQGSGKSFSMLFLVKNVSQLVPGTTFLIVTDRNDLDNQLSKTFKNASEYIGQKIHQIESIENLKEELKDRKQDGIYFTTVQKFNSTIGQLSERNNILVITDEAHRSHTNIENRLVYDDETKEIVEKSGNAKYLRDAFPKATFMGFTGTPIEKEDKSTSQIFGEVITRYLMSDAERDGVVVPIRYESRKAEMIIQYDELEKLNQSHEQHMNEVEDKTNIPGEVQKKINKSIQKIKNIISDPDRIDGVAKDFIKHYESREHYLRGKAMFVAFNRHIAFSYYNKLLELRPEWKEKVKLIITNSNGQSDSPEMHELAGTGEYRKRMAEEFKKKDSDFKIAIVVDMWLTGFDVPSLDSIYLDKPIKMHNLMQTIARTNRVYTDGNMNKEYGLVIDYIGLWKQLNEALAFYSDKSTHETQSIRDLENLKPQHIESIERILKEFELEKLIDDNVFEDQTKWVDVLEKMTNTIYKNKMQQNFVNATKKVSKWMNEVVSLLTKKEMFNFQILYLVRNNIINRELGLVDFREIEKDLLNQMTKVIKYKETSIISEVEGDAILISDIIKFINEKEKEKEGLEYYDLENKIAATRKVISLTRKINYRRSEDLSKKLLSLLEKYNNKFVSMEELINGIKSIAKAAEEMSESIKDKHGFTPEELAFYDIISSPVKGEFDEEKIKLITEELLEIINKSEDIIETWSYNDQSKRKVRMELKVLLDKHGYPPKEFESATKDVVKQIMYQRDIKEN